MKFVILILCAVLISVSFPTTGHCEMDTRLTTLGNTPVNKLIRGLVNCLTFPLELPASICDVTKRKGLLSGCTLGVADGFFTSLLRLGTGVIDTVTFPIPPYDKPLLKPEYAIDSAADKMGTPNVDW
jgi:putative exosortase-associated protein (TIGR04073 family)